MPIFKEELSNSMLVHLLKMLLFLASVWSLATIANVGLDFITGRHGLSVSATFAESPVPDTHTIAYTMVNTNVEARADVLFTCYVHDSHGILVFRKSYYPMVIPPLSVIRNTKDKYGPYNKNFDKFKVTCEIDSSSNYKGPYID